MGTDASSGSEGVPDGGGISGGAGERGESRPVLDPEWITLPVPDGNNVLTPEDVEKIIADAPRKGDPSCPHPPDRQVVDGHGLVCLDCTVIQVIAW